MTVRIGRTVRRYVGLAALPLSLSIAACGAHSDLASWYGLRIGDPIPAGVKIEYRSAQFFGVAPVPPWRTAEAGQDAHGRIAWLSFAEPRCEEVLDDVPSGANDPPKRCYTSVAQFQTDVAAVKRDLFSKLGTPSGAETWSLGPGNVQSRYTWDFKPANIGCPGPRKAPESTGRLADAELFLSADEIRLSVNGLNHGSTLERSSFPVTPPPIVAPPCPALPSQDVYR